MEKQTLGTVLSLCDEIDTLLANSAPMADPQRLQRIQSLCMRLTPHNHYIAEKSDKLARRAAIYLSARKHQKHPGGADGLMFEMRYSLLGAIREQAKFLEKGVS